MAETDASDEENGKSREEGREGYGTEGMGSGLLKDGEVDHSFEMDVYSLETWSESDRTSPIRASFLIDICY